MASAKSKALSKLKDVYGEPGKTFSELPEQDYVGVYKGLSLDFSEKKPDVLQAIMTLEVTEPEENAGRTVKKFFTLDDKGFPYFKGAMEMLGFEFPDDIDDLESAITEFDENHDGNIVVEFKVARTEGTGENKGKKFTNIYINGVKDGESGGEELEKGKEVDEEREELLKKIKKNKLDINPDDYEDNDDLEKAIEKALKKKKK